ncbi:DUF3231 family protein [Candidatus Contubernalis alkaliaceticus]|uniref:DUF3231 family protein n=1 Tax=Candidatus Contubernalis alkaliaceticus TaxID=338645 RepID=UPI001F4C5287|nr:DUF3231 family protein [Candidatus Contubernalis alkalaceticus]UNC91620.1 DUF3231 family protein [Candidatus Contubernalis alkalaceticus]
MGILNDDKSKNDHLHYGEAFGIWTYLLVSQGLLSAYQTYINHAGDKELKNFLGDMIENVLRPEIEKTQELLKVTGIALPPAPPEKAKASLEDIPAGARINDPEISGAVAMDIAGGLLSCSEIMGISVREDVGAMFGQFHMNKAQHGLRLLRLNKDKGWMVIPPIHERVREFA